jgi:hypothetical protein
VLVSLLLPLLLPPLPLPLPLPLALPLPPPPPPLPLLPPPLLLAVVALGDPSSLLKCISALAAPAPAGGVSPLGDRDHHHLERVWMTIAAAEQEGPHGAPAASP